MASLRVLELYEKFTPSYYDWCKREGGLPPLVQEIMEMEDRIKRLTAELREERKKNVKET